MIPCIATLMSILASNGCFGEGVPEARFGGFQPFKGLLPRLVAETLQVTLHEDSAEVRARYWLDNPGDALQGTYGAPIDHGLDPEEPDSLAWSKFLFENATLSVDGNPPVALAPRSPTHKTFTLPSAWFQDRGATDTAPQKIQGWRRWFIGNASIPHGKHVLTLRAKVQPSYMDGSGKGSSYEASRSDRVLLWDFTPAGGWGKGIVETLHIRIDASHLDADTIPVNVIGLPFKRDGHILTLDRRRLDMNRMPPLTIRWSPDSTFRRRMVAQGAMRGIRWHGSAEVADYPLSNLSDFDFRTAWVAPRDGKGSWLEADLPPDFDPQGIVICGGYAKSEKTYYDNAAPIVARLFWQPTRIVPVYGDTSNIPADDRSQLLSPDTMEINTNCHTSAFPPDPGIFSYGLTQLNPWESPFHRAGGHMRIEFPKIQPGRRSQDMAVTEILFLH